MLTAFVDDSGNHNETPVMVLAGFVARSDAWAAFSEEWTASLKQAGVSSFKMNHCYARRGAFTGWNREQRDFFVLELIDIIRRHVMASAFSIVRLQDYRQFIDLHGNPKGHRSPYSLLYHAIIAAVLRSLRSFNLDDKVNFVFDEQLTISDVLERGFSESLKLMEPTLASRLANNPIHRSDDNSPPLQAADLLAWHIRRWYDADAKEEKFAPKSLLLLRKIPFWGMVLDKEGLASITDASHELQLKNDIQSAVERELIKAGLLPPHTSAIKSRTHFSRTSRRR